MRPRRGFDRPPEEPRTRINEAIRVPQVRLIGADGEQIGLKDRDDALEYAWDLNLDLVEVAADARPPVCRVMDYSKYKYEQEQKAKLARKHQNVIVIKEIKLRPKVGAHDYETKKGHVVRFLKNHDKVKVTIMFRGREMQHPELGRKILDQVAEAVAEVGKVEVYPRLDGRNMTMVLGPDKKAQAAAEKKRSAPESTEADDALLEGDTTVEPTAAEPTAVDSSSVDSPAVESSAASTTEADDAESTEASDSPEA